MRRVHAVVVGVVLVLLVQAWLIALGVNPLHTGGGWDLLWDPDSYARVLRVRDLAEGGAWYDPVFRWVNYPDGIVLHWTRLLDVLILVPAKLASVAVPFDAALFGWALALGPTLQIAALVALAWGTRRFLSAGQLLLLATLFALQRGISYDFVPGLVDHHGLQLLLLIVSLAALYREPHHARAAYVAGAASGLALWASAECVVVVFALTTGLGVQWILDDARADGRRLMRYGAALLATSAAALVCERGPTELLVPSFDRLSIVQVALAAAVATGGVALALFSRGGVASRMRRLAVAGSIAVAAVLALVSEFPSLARHPYDATTEVIRSEFLAQVPMERAFLPTGPDGAYDFVLEMGPALLALGYCVWRLRSRDVDDAARSRCTVSVVALAVFIPYAIFTFRGLPFVGAAAIVPWAEAISTAWRHARAATPRARLRERLLRGALPVAAAAGFWVVAGAIAVVWMPRFVYSHAPVCRWDRLAKLLPPPAPGVFQRAVLTGLFDGPEVAFRTHRPVLGAPLHNNAEGIQAGISILGASDPDALPLLDARGVEWVALCKSMTADVANVLRRSPFGLGARLFVRVPPSRLVEVPLPPDLGGTFVLYRRERDPGAGGEPPGPRGVAP